MIEALVVHGDGGVDTGTDDSLQQAVMFIAIVLVGNLCHLIVTMDTAIKTNTVATAAGVGEVVDEAW